MAEQNKGFTLPAPADEKPQPPATQSREAVAPPPSAAVEQVAGDKGVIIGLVVVVLFMVVFFFVKNAYANGLVERKLAPRRAERAGWWLFVMLTALAATAVFAIVDQARFFTFIFAGPLLVIALVALVLLILGSRRG